MIDNIMNFHFLNQSMYKITGRNHYIYASLSQVKVTPRLTHTLYHEFADNSMERWVDVRPALWWALAQLVKVLNGIGCDVTEQAQHDSPSRLSADADVQERLVGHEEGLVFSRLHIFVTLLSFEAVYGKNGKQF